MTGAVQRLCSALANRFRVLGADEVGRHLPLAFDQDLTTRFAIADVSKKLPSHFGDLNSSGLAVAFHAGGRIDGISPHIVRKFVLSDYTGDNRSGVHSDS